MISVCVFDVIISKERLLPTDTVKAPGGLLFSNDSTLKGNEKCSWLQTNNKVLKKNAFTGGGYVKTNELLEEMMMTPPLAIKAPTDYLATSTGTPDLDCL